MSAFADFQTRYQRASDRDEHQVCEALDNAWDQAVDRLEFQSVGDLSQADYQEKVAEVALAIIDHLPTTR